MHIKYPRLVVYSCLALLCLVLTFTVNWLFIIGAVLLMFLGQKELGNQLLKSKIPKKDLDMKNLGKKENK